MESHNFVGIYIGKAHAVVVGIRVKGHDCRITGSFSVSVDTETEARTQLLIKEIADGCGQHKIKADEAVVALDCSLYMQHAVHSEFSAIKQIASTVRFDTEEVLATDVSTMAVSFEVESQNDHGSQLNVFTADQEIISDILLNLQSRGIDPIAVVPDIRCLGEFAKNYGQTEDGLFAILSEQRGYFVSALEKKFLPVRAFMIGANVNRTELLNREVFTTMAASGSQGEAGLHVFDSNSQVDVEQLAERLGMNVTEADWFRTSGTGPNAQADEADPVDYAVAMGAALLKGQREHWANFRDDFMPFQGKRMRMQSALKWASISVTILFLAIGAYLQIQTYLTQQYRKKLYERVSASYPIAMPGRTLTKKANPVTNLKRELRKLDDQQGGSGSAQTVSDRMTAVLGAMNTVASTTQIEVEKLEVTEKNITIDGTTVNNDATIRLKNAIEKTGFLEVDKPSMSQGPNRRSLFRMTIKTNTKKGS